jgi:hypothetical protein
MYVIGWAKGKIIKEGLQNGHFVMAKGRQFFYHFSKQLSSHPHHYFAKVHNVKLQVHIPKLAKSISSCRHWAAHRLKKNWSEENLGSPQDERTWQVGNVDFIDVELAT